MRLTEQEKRMALQFQLSEAKDTIVKLQIERDALQKQLDIMKSSLLWVEVANLRSECDALLVANRELREACIGLLDFIKEFNMGGDWHQDNYPAIKNARAVLAKQSDGK